MGERETEAQKSRTEIAEYLRDLAEQLDGGGDVTLRLGGTAVLLDPVDPVTFKLEGESAGPRATRRPNRASSSNWCGGATPKRRTKER